MVYTAQLDLTPGSIKSNVPLEAALINLRDTSQLSLVSKNEIINNSTSLNGIWTFDSIWRSDLD